MLRNPLMRAGLAFGASGFFLVALLLMLQGNGEAEPAPYSTASLLAMVLAAGVFAALGVALLRSRRLDPEEQRLGSPYRHVWRLVSVATVAVAGVLLLHNAVYPDTYGEFGPYRGSAVAKARHKRPVLHQGADKCGECHAEQKATHDKDMHYRVECETCHGPGRIHVLAHGEGGATGPGDVLPPGAELTLPRAKNQCLRCHRHLKSRPRIFPQVEPAEHYQLTGVAKGSTPCVVCHDPHQPLFLAEGIQAARLHPVMHQCDDCHARPADPNAKRPTGHPIVFECSYCHAKTADDHAERTHGEMSCGICHQFHRLSEEAGRIVKNGNPEFCLLCHGGGDFRSDQAPPAVKWPEHRAEMGDGEADANKRCVDCHRESIHLKLSEEHQREMPEPPPEPVEKAVEPPAEKAVEPPAEKAVEPTEEKPAEPEAKKAEEPEAKKAEEPEAKKAEEPEAKKAEEPVEDGE